MAKRTATCLEVATAVAKDCATVSKDNGSPEKKIKKSKKRCWYINNKKELLLTFPDTYEILTKEMVGNIQDPLIFTDLESRTPGQAGASGTSS